MTDKDKVSVEDYSAVVDLAEIIDVKLVQSEFEIKPAYFLEDDSGVRHLYGCDAITAHFDGEGKRLIGVFNVEAGAKKGRKFLLKTKAVYVVAFEISGDPVEEAALTYLRRVGAFACWPYFRSHFASLCAAAGADAPVLPVMRGNLPRKIE